MTHIDKHVLYMKKTCPYCIKVMRFMESAGISLETRDTAIPSNQNELIRIGGKKQVPCLVIDGKALYESDDIIAYLKKNFVS